MAEAPVECDYLESLNKSFNSGSNLNFGLPYFLLDTDNSEEPLFSLKYPPPNLPSNYHETRFPENCSDLDTHGQADYDLNIAEFFPRTPTLRSSLLVVPEDASGHGSLAHLLQENNNRDILALGENTQNTSRPFSSKSGFDGGAFAATGTPSVKRRPPRANVTRLDRLRDQLDAERAERSQERVQHEAERAQDERKYEKLLKKYKTLKKKDNKRCKMFARLKVLLNEIDN